MSNKPVTQEWTHSLSLMQQSVLLTAIRGPDGLPKYGAIKSLLRWFRRCTLVSAFEGCVLTNPGNAGGGSFTGPSIELRLRNGWEADMDIHVSQYLRELDAIPHHFQLHFMHAVEIVGYKHPEERNRRWWHSVYVRLVHDMHLHPETERELDERLGDSREGWLARSDPATAA